MEIVAGVAGIFGPVEQLIELLREVKKRWDATKAHPDQAKRLETLYHRHISNVRLVKQLNSSDNGTSSRLAKQIAAPYIEDINLSIQNSTNVLRDILEKIDHTAEAFARADKHEALLAALEHDVEHLDIIILLLFNTLSSQDSTTAPRSGFKAAVSVSRNCLDLVLDYVSQQENGIPSTCEGKLMRALLGDSPIVAAVSTCSGGVGKTCALKGLANCTAMKLRFPGGMYFMSLSKDSVEKDIVRELSKIVAASGDELSADSISKQRSLLFAISTASAWFKDKECLFMIDDVWPGNLGEQTLQALSMLTMSNDTNLKGNRIVYSSRDRFVEKYAECVLFKPKVTRSNQSRAILLTTAGLLHISHAKYPMSTVYDILDVCQGCPLTLSMAGRYLWTKVGMDQSSPSELLNSYAISLKSFPTALQDGLEAIVSISLSLLDGEAPVEENHPNAYRNAFMATSILQKNCWAPMAFLRKLWDLKDERDGERIVDNLSRLRLVESDTRLVNAKVSKYCTCIRLHERVHELSKTLASKVGTDWNKKVLQIYQNIQPKQEKKKTLVQKVRCCISFRNACCCLPTSSHSSVSNQSDERRDRHQDLLDQSKSASTEVYTAGDDKHSDTCWPASLVDDGYILANVGRMLIDDGAVDLLGRTLRDVRWIVKMMDPKYTFQYEHDVESYVNEQFSRDNSMQSPRLAQCKRISPVHTEESRLLRLLCGVLRRSIDFGQGSEQKRWFQLYARLQMQGNEINEQWKLRSSKKIRQFARRPCLWPVTSCFRGESHSAPDKYEMKFSVHFGNFFKDGWMIICGRGSNGQDFFVQHILCGRPLRHKKIKAVHLLEDVRRERYELPNVNPSKSSSESYLAGVHRSSASYLATSNYKKTQSVEVDTGTARSDQSLLQGGLSSDTERASSFSTSPDGSLVVYGLPSGTVRVINISTNQEACPPFSAHKSEVTSVAASSFGCWVVSGSTDCSVRMWDTSPDGGLHSSFFGHTMTIRSVAMNADGTRVVSGSDDCTVGVWNRNSALGTFPPLLGHTMPVSNVSISANGHIIASGSEDHTVRVWNLRRGKPMPVTLVGHTGIVNSVTLTADGKRVLSAADDQTVRIWDVESGSECLPLLPHERPVKCVSISPDGSKVLSTFIDNTVLVWKLDGINVSTSPAGHSKPVCCVCISDTGSIAVSGSFDNNMLVWNADTGETIGVPLMGHTDTVMSVSISSDGKFIASGSKDLSVRVWESRTSARVFPPLIGHTDWVMSTAISHDGSRVVSASTDKTIRVWDVSQAEQIGSALVGHTQWVMGVALSADKHRVVSWSGDHTVRLWEVGKGPLEFHKCKDWDEMYDVFEMHRRELCEEARIERGKGGIAFSANGAEIEMQQQGQLRLKVAEFESGIASFTVDRSRRRVVAGLYDGTVAIMHVEV